MKITITEHHLNKALKESDPNNKKNDYCRKCVVAQAISETFPGESVSVAGTDIYIGKDHKYSPDACDFVLLYDQSQIDELKMRLPAEIEIFDENPYNQELEDL